MPGGVVNHLYQFTVPTAGNVGSIKFEYCTLAAGTCTLPTGVDTSTATIGTQTGATGFTIVTTTNGAPYLTRTAANVNANTQLTYQLMGVTNPSEVNKTFFVRISTYASTDTSGSATDTGSVTASTARQIVIDGIMPESLVFCTAETIGLTAGVPDCATALDGSISFNQLFSPQDTATATSQLAASTNAGFGYVITVNGNTLTSGSNTISGMSAIDTSKKGISQFGLNLKANTVSSSNPAVGTEIAVASNGTNYKGQAIGDYRTVDNFKFVTGEAIANSAYDGAANNTLGGTDSQIYTASYIVNVPGSQPAGTYATTLTYICTATY